MTKEETIKTLSDYVRRGVQSLESSIAEAFEQGQINPHWISVEDELPPNNGGFSDEVWTYNLATNQCVVAQFNYISNCWFGCDDSVTHWMLVKPPKKGGE